MSFSHTDSQFLPLDSSIKQCLPPEYSTSFGNISDSLYSQQSEVSFLMNKISQLQKNYSELQKKYIRKIKQLKQQLSQKHHVQSSLSQELSNLSKQYEQHKQEIQKISDEIKKSFQDNLQKDQKQTKIKSVSPKNPANNSPKRLIKKSLEIAKNQHIQSKKQLISKEVSDSHEITNTSTTQKSGKAMKFNTYLTHESKKTLVLDEDSFKISDQNSLNVSNQTKNGRKLLYSPSNQGNGPSPKKKLLFNSSKELDLFSKPLGQKKITALTNNSPSRRINISPMQKRKQNPLVQNKMNDIQVENSNQKQVKKQLAVIQEKPTKREIKQNEQKHQNHLVAAKPFSPTHVQPSSPTHRKKTSSPQTLGMLRKKISNKTLTIKTDFDTKQHLKNEKSHTQTKQQKKDIKQLEPTIGQKQIETQKKTAKSPLQSSKLIKFSPGRKLINNSPTHKKTESAFEVKPKPKLLGNMREKFDDNLFK